MPLSVSCRGLFWLFCLVWLFVVCVVLCVVVCCLFVWLSLLVKQVFSLVGLVSARMVSPNISSPPLPPVSSVRSWRKTTQPKYVAQAPTLGANDPVPTSCRPPRPRRSIHPPLRPWGASCLPPARCCPPRSSHCGRLGRPQPVVPPAKRVATQTVVLALALAMPVVDVGGAGARHKCMRTWRRLPRHWSHARASCRDGDAKAAPRCPPWIIPRALGWR